MKLVKPKTYLIGHTVIDMPEIIGYLRDTGQESFIEEIENAKEQGLSDGEILCSFYAKACYAALTTEKNENISRVRSIYDNILGTIESGHGSVAEHCCLNFMITDCSRVFTHELVRHRVGTAFCLHGDTEIWSGAKNKGKWIGIRKKWKLKDLYEKLNNSRTRHTTLMATVRVWDGSEFQTARIKDVVQSGIKQMSTMKLCDSLNKITATEDHLFLTKSGWKRMGDLEIGEEVATNGRIAYRDKDWLFEKYRTQNLSQNRIAEMCGVKPITVRQWVRKFGIQKDHTLTQFKPGLVPWNTGKKYRTNYKCSEEHKDKMRKLHTKEGNPMWVGDLVTDQGARMRAIRWHKTEQCEHCGDLNGHRHHKDRDVRNNERDNIQFLCSVCHGKLHYVEDGPRNVLTVKWRRVESITKDQMAMSYDLEVDHPSHNFVANGIVTHNSQTSGRYVRTDSLNVVFDPILDPVKEEFEETLVFIECQYAKMVEKMGLGGMKDFGKKKKITSALRRMLPNGQANEMGFSVNLRTLRQTLIARTSRHAEWEIRVIFNQMAEIVRGKYPAFFLDADYFWVDDAYEITFKHGKI